MSAAPMTYRKVLVVEDDAIMRELLTALLEIEGYEAYAAESGEDALEFLSSGAEVDVVLVDLHMPGLQGAELAKRLHQARPQHTLLLAMSASKLKPEHTGLFAAFLQKPFDVDNFTQAVQAASAQRMGVDAAEGSYDRTEPTEIASLLDENIFGRMESMLPAAQLRELYRMTIDDVLRRVKLMRASLKSGDDDAIRAEAHAIKGGCGMVGANELSKLASDVEAGARQGSEVGNPPFTDFDAACARLQVMLDARFQDDVETG